jgi:hypothetical protein
MTIDRGGQSACDFEVMTLAPIASRNRVHQTPRSLPRPALPFPRQYLSGTAPFHAKR